MDRKIFFVLMFIGLIVPNSTWAQAPSSPPPNATVTFLRNSVASVLDTNPELQAAKAKVAAVQAQIRGAGLPLNNPQLAIDIESASENTVALGLSQTLDWHDKQSTQRALLDVMLQEAEAEHIRLTMTLANDVLSALAGYYSEIEVRQYHQQRIELLQKIVGLAESRLAAGDIDKSELLLARLSLADAVIEHANQGARVIEAQKAFFALSQLTLDEQATFFSTLLDNTADDSKIESIAAQHPLEIIALLRVEQARRQVAVRQRERRADPELGITLGRDGDETLMGVQFSIPWQVRNDFSYTVDVAQQARIQAELAAQNTHRQILADIKAAKSLHQLTANAWTIWLETGQSQLKEHIQLLDRLWKNGDLSTTDYLVQLEQNIHTQIAGVELKASVWQAWFQWLTATGRVMSWLNLNTEYRYRGEQ